MKKKSFELLSRNSCHRYKEYFEQYYHDEDEYMHHNHQVDQLRQHSLVQRIAQIPSNVSQSVQHLMKEYATEDPICNRKFLKSISYLSSTEIM